MGTKGNKKRTLAEAFAALAEEFPLAKGSVTDTHCPCTRKGCRLCAAGKGHAKTIFTYREGGKLRGLYIRPGHARLLREAVDNGRALERLLAKSGRDLVMSLREADAD